MCCQVKNSFFMLFKTFEVRQNEDFITKLIFICRELGSSA